MTHGPLHPTIGTVVTTFGATRIRPLFIAALGAVCVWAGFLGPGSSDAAGSVFEYGFRLGGAALVVLPLKWMLDPRPVVTVGTSGFCYRGWSGTITVPYEAVVEFDGVDLTLHTGAKVPHLGVVLDTARLSDVGWSLGSRLKWYLSFWRRPTLVMSVYGGQRLVDEVVTALARAHSTATSGQVAPSGQL